MKLKPDWAVVLSFEHKLRKEAFKLVLNDGFTLADALRDVTKNAELKEAFFTTPIALRAASGIDNPPQSKWPRTSAKGFGAQFKGSFKSAPKGKGKGRSKGNGKPFDERLQGLVLLWRTPDGRDLCFSYNHGSCDGNCGRIHKCRVKGCLKDHPAVKHKEMAGGA